MSLLWCDGFDHYGTGATGRTNMLNGVWAEVTTSISPSSVQSRTGGNSLLVGNNGNQTARRVFPGGDRSTIGFGCGIYVDNLPTAADKIAIAQFRNNSNADQISFVLSTTGQIQAKRGSETGTLLGESAPVITAAAWNHFECRVFCDDAAGTVEVRVNGETVLDLSGIDTRGQASGLMAQVAVRNSSGANPGTATYYDDAFCWDTAGSLVNDFVGPQRVYRLMPNGNTAEADWATTGAASGYEAIDEAAPDADTSYIAAATVGDISEFDLEALPAEVSAVTALYVTPMLRKADAGTANVRASMVSGASVGAGADRPITEVYTYWPDIFETDPATGAPWTGSAVNAAKLRLEKTA